MEKDDEITGTTGSIYTTEFRMLDTRLGRWWSVDPKRAEHESPYVAMGNRPTFFTDFLGDTVYQFNNKGRYIGKVDDGKEDVIGGILMSKKSTSYARTFSFNDVAEDTKGLRKGDIKGIVFMPDRAIQKRMEWSGVLKKENQENKWDYAEAEGVSGGQMDYLLKLPYSNRLYLTDNGVAYNNYDAGNFLWGQGMKKLGFSEWQAQWAAEYVAWKYGKKWYPGEYKGGWKADAEIWQKQWWMQKTWTGDAQADQDAIEQGHRYQIKKQYLLYKPFDFTIE